jgi:hypothetical protein
MRVREEEHDLIFGVVHPVRGGDVTRDALGSRLRKYRTLSIFLTTSGTIERADLL